MNIAETRAYFSVLIKCNLCRKRLPVRLIINVINCNAVSRNTRIVTRIGRFRDMRFHNIVNKVHFDLHAHIELNKE